MEEGGDIMNLKNQTVFWRAFSYFRIGYGQYLSLAVSLGNMFGVAYLIITQTFTIDPFFGLILFTIISVPALISAGTIIGWKHMKKAPFIADAKVKFDNNPRMMEMYKNIEKILEILEE